MTQIHGALLCSFCALLRSNFFVSGDILSLISQYNRNTRRLAKGQHQDLFTYIYNVYDVVGDDYHSSSDESEKMNKRADEMSDSDAPSNAHSNPPSNPPSNAPSDTPTLEMSPDEG